MYVPDKWNMGSIDNIHQFIEQHGFAIMFAKNLEADHLPLILNRNEGEFGTLYGHMARSNPNWKLLDNADVLIVFNGAHSYISPTWYSLKPAVPTWNYSAVHVLGKVELTTDAVTSEGLFSLIKKYEPELLKANETVMPEEFVSKLSKGIVGFKITISQLQGKEKLGQHRAKADQVGVTAALSQSTDLNAVLLHDYMKQRKLGLGE